jgi:hypothetical protein
MTRLLKRLGLACWCCGTTRVMFYRWHPLMLLTWCSECKFAVCERCGPDDRQEAMATEARKYRRKRP